LSGWKSAGRLRPHSGSSPDPRVLRRSNLYPALENWMYRS
jgi:hypothetical protein